MSCRPDRHTLPLDLHGWPCVERADLTEAMAVLADEAGLEAVRFLVARFGSTKQSVPKRYKGPDRLPAWLEETAQEHSVSLVKRIITLFGGEIIDIPSPSPLHLAAIRRAIRREYDGRNAGTLAIRYHVSRRFVLEAGLER